MKKAYKIISLLLCLFVVLISICSKPIKVEATGGHFGQDVFTKGWTWTNSSGATFDAYSMEDTSGLPSGYFYFYKIRDGECIALEASEVITNILNNKVGIIGSLNMIADFILQYTSDHFGWTLYDTPVSGRNVFPDATRVVIKGSSLIGVAMTDLTGCRLVNSVSNDQSVSVPSDCVDSIYNYYTYVYLIENPELPDYINVPCATKATAIEGGLTGDANIAYFDSPAKTYNFGVQYGSTAKWVKAIGGSSGYVLFLEGDNWYFVSKSTSTFDTICETYGLSLQNYQISLADAIASTNTTQLQLTPYDKTTNQGETGYLKSYRISTGSTVNNEGYASVLGSKWLPYSAGKEYITVYRTANIVTQITNNVYAPRSYQTTNYKNYNTSNNNSYNTNVQSINNSSSNNTTIYNETKTENNETIVEDSYNVNNTTITNNTTNITNNYYGDNGGGSGGGDDNGDDDNDDDTIWKALLKAIGDFLKKIGELIATILTGLVSILTSVLDAIAAITTNFTGVTTFISSVFGFLPSDVLAVITLGITLGILISLIKMFGK